MLQAETSTSSGLQSSSRHLVHVPAKAYIIFDNVPKPSAIIGKIRDFNASTPPALQLSQEELADGGVSCLPLRHVQPCYPPALECS